jgi:hypothetical protein
MYSSVMRVRMLRLRRNGSIIGRHGALVLESLPDVVVGDLLLSGKCLSVRNGNTTVELWEPSIRVVDTGFMVFRGFERVAINHVDAAVLQEWAITQVP